MPGRQAFLLFHANLAFSSVPEEERVAVVERCYLPLLDLAEQGIPLGFEATGWTLGVVESLHPGFCARLRALQDTGLLEFVGSGWSQVAGPLAPWPVNDWNLRQGALASREHLGAIPRMWLVHEMTFAPSLIDAWVEAGIEAVVLEASNVEAALGRRPGTSLLPGRFLSEDGRGVDILWARTSLFQRLQRAVHGEIDGRDYQNAVRLIATRHEGALPLYAGDAEVFGYRPGRFATEAPVNRGEWSRLRELVEGAVSSLGLELRLPSACHRPGPAVRPSFDAAHPVAVKKQVKYNIARWAVGGRDSCVLNARTHALVRAATTRHPDGPPDHLARLLCEAWSSDHRTHLGDARWDRALDDLSRLEDRLALRPPVAAAPAGPPGADEPPPVLVQDGFRLTVATSTVRIVLLLRRGLAVESLGFAPDFEPLVGHLPQGTFAGVELDVDFYTGGVVIEGPGVRPRVADLVPVVPQIRVEPDGVVVEAGIPTRLGTILRTVRVARDAPRVEVGSVFEGWSRPFASVRAGEVTLLPGSLGRNLVIRTCQGGHRPDLLPVLRPVEHHRPAPTTSSCTGGFGASEGWLEVAGERRGLRLSWDPCVCAVLPLLHAVPGAHPDGDFVRLVFSLAEVDDTTRPGGTLPPFVLLMQPAPPWASPGPTVPSDC